MPDQFFNKRIRRVNKIIPFVAGGSDYFTCVGPTTEIILEMVGTADAHTIDPSGGMPCAVSRLVAQTNRRGTIWDMSGVECEMISQAFFNGPAKVDTTAGTTADGVMWVLPLSLDPGEMCTFTVTFGALGDIAGTGDLAGFAANLCPTVVVGQPKSYFAFRGRPWGVGGVVAIGAAFTEPQIPIVPGFALTGEGLNSAITNSTTFVTNALFTPAYVLCQHGDDYLIDTWARALHAYMIKRAYAGRCHATGAEEVVAADPAFEGPPWCMTVWRHTPVANNDATQLTITNGPTATAIDHITRVLFIYISGAITKEQSVAPLSTPQVGGEVTTQQPARALEATQTAGTAMGKPLKAWYNLR